MRRVALLAGLALVVGWPAVQPHAADGFPVSNYPMFARRSGSVVALDTAVGIDVDGVVHRLGPAALGGGGEVMLASELARRAVDEGDDSTAAYCREVADRIDDVTIARVEVRTEVRDAIADVAADDAPIDVVVHATCEVRR